MSKRTMPLALVSLLRVSLVVCVSYLFWHVICSPTDIIVHSVDPKAAHTASAVIVLLIETVIVAITLLRRYINEKETT